LFQPFLLHLVVLFAAAQSTPTLIITNARIADGGGGPIVFGKVVVISGDTIIKITDQKKWKTPAGVREIDGSGLVLSPGFIDTHNHSDSKILEKPGAESQVRQGITTFVGGQDGSSQVSIAAFFEKAEKTGMAINMASTVGFGSLRSKVMGDDWRRAARPDEIVKMKTLLDQDMKDGAFGLSSGIEYEPDSYSTTDELVEVAKTIKPYGGYYVSHVRDEGAHVLDSWRELMTIAERASIPGQISHIKFGSVSAWHEFPKYTELMKQADAKGLKITADCYPYNFWHSTLRVLVLSRRYDDLNEVKRGVDDNGGPENIILTAYLPDPSVVGKSLAQIAKEKNMDPYQLYMQMIRETDPSTHQWGENQEVESILGASTARTTSDD